jgi:virulence-associated protein VagC
VSRHGRGVLLEPVIENSTDWFAEMDKHADDTFLEEGRDQPPTPERDMFD